MSKNGRYIIEYTGIYLFFEFKSKINKMVFKQKIYKTKEGDRQTHRQTKVP